MKAEEKKILYNLIKTSSQYINGYTPDFFQGEEPVFTDDVAEEQKVISDIQTAEKKGISIEEIASKISRCTRCGLARTRTNVVPGMGVKNPYVMVIGEGPGAEEDAQGKPFVGKAGILLDRMLAAIQLERNTNCFIANIVKCRPPQNRDPYPDEQAACISFLDAQIHCLKPKMILCLGRISSHKLLNTEEALGKLRGNFFEYNGIPLLVTYHPSALLRNEELKRPAWEDLKLFKTKLLELAPDYAANFKNPL